MTREPPLSAFVRTALLTWVGVLSMPAQADPSEPINVLFVGDAIAAEVSKDLLGFLAADPRFEPDVRLFHTGELNLSEAWSAHDFLGPSEEEEVDLVILQEKSHLPSFAYLATRPELYGEEEIPPEVVQGSEAFWSGGETVGRAVLERTEAALTLFPLWPVKSGAEGFVEFFPPDTTSSAMRTYTAASQKALSDLLESEGVVVAAPDIDPVWSHFEDVLEVDLYGDEPVLGSALAHYVAAAVLYRQIARRSADSAGYEGDFVSALAAQYRSAVDLVLDAFDPLPGIEVVPPEEEKDSEQPDDPSGEESPPEDPDDPVEPEIVAEDFDVLLAGGPYTTAIQEILLGLFAADPRATLRTLRVMGGNGEDLFALTRESDALASALADEAWDVVVLEETNYQDGLTGVNDNRWAYEVGAPASNVLASHRFRRGGRLAIKQVLEQPEISLVFLAPWPLQSGHPGLEAFPREKTPEAMRAYQLRGYEILFDEEIPGGHQRVALADTGGAWLAGQVALPQLDFYGSDGVLGGTPGRYLAAGVLFEKMTQFRVLGNTYDVGLPEAQLRALQEIVGQISGITEREPEPETPDPDPDDGSEEPGEDDEEPEPEVGAGEPLSILLLGNLQLGLVEDELVGMLEAEGIAPSVTTLLGENLRSLWGDPSVKAQISQGDWDAVIIQEEQRQPALAFMEEWAKSHWRPFFNGLMPAYYALASYNFYRGGSRLAKLVLQETTAKVFFSASWPLDDSRGALAEFPPGENSVEMQGYTNRAYADLVAALPAEHRSRMSAVPVGDAWLRSRASAPTLDLYGNSASDGGANGHYLSAAVLFEALTGTVVSQNSYRGVLRPVAAEFLRAIVSQDVDGQLTFDWGTTLQMPSLDSIDPETPVVEVLNASMDAVAPLHPRADEHALFQSYTSTGRSVWADNWTRPLDFSGVAWDRNQAGTLIADQYMVFARHYPRDTGSQVKFTDRSGEIVTRTIEAQELIWFDAFPVRADMKVSRLNEPVPDTVAVYRLVPGDIEPNELLGAKVLHTYRDRVVYMSEVSRFQLFDHDSEVATTRRNADVIDPAWDHLVWLGDSGHPSFLVLNGELLLFSTHTFGGYGSKGPYYGGRGNQAKIRKAIAKMESAAQERDG